MVAALPDASQNQTPDEHMQISRRFIEHARDELAKDERLQASQKIWGAEQHALVAVGKTRGWRTENYQHKDAIAYHLAEEFRKGHIQERHDSYDRYHVNFYQNHLADERAIETAIDSAEQFVNDMEDIRAKGPQPFTISDARQISRLRQLAGDRVTGSLKVGQTYEDGFVNQRRLARYQSQWQER